MLVAPIDREDLFRLSRSIDDVLDNLRDFVREWDLYEIEAAGDVRGRAPRHRQRRRRPPPGGADDRQGPRRHEPVRPRVQEAANEIRRLYDVELGRLFAGELTMEVLKSRELLRRLDVVGLRLNEAADVLADAAVKHRA